jgi:mono-ADP-ribosyltransferase sirtuin 6
MSGGFAGGKLVIVNLQKTPKDKHAALLLRGRADEVMRAVMSRLQIPVPPFVRRDTFLAHISQHSGSGNRDSLEMRISSPHGPECPLPLVSTVDITFPVSPF